MQRKCPGKMVEMSTSEGVTVDFCPETKGILFDPGEMAEYFELSEDFPALVRRGAQPTGRYWECPKHPGARMIEYRFPALEDLTLDVCEKGRCVWFDQGEIPRFETLTAHMEAPQSRLLRVFRQLDHKGYQVLGVEGGEE